MLKITTIVGARPQFIKAAVVSRAIAQAGDVEERIIHTGQHYDHGMSDVFFKELDIPRPHLHLEVGSMSQGAQTGRMLEGIEAALIQERPDWLLVYGDTNSTLAGALAAAKLHIPVAHVEAGLRSFNKRMPEEINRILTDHISEILMIPTHAARINLEREGLVGDRVRMVGDVMYDAALYYKNRAEYSGVIQAWGLVKNGYVLATIHRAENTDDPERLRSIKEGLRTISKDIPVVLPLHPRTRQKLSKDDLERSSEGGILFKDPVGYLDMVALESGAKLIVTDSGGVQKEAFFHGVPCVTLRDETEWVELVDAGWNTLVPPSSPLEISQGVSVALNMKIPPQVPGLYGHGDAGQRVVACLKDERL